MDPRLEIYAPHENELLPIDFPRRPPFTHISAVRKKSKRSADDASYKGYDGGGDDDDDDEGDEEGGSAGNTTEKEDDHEGGESGDEEMQEEDDIEGGESGDGEMQEEDDIEGGEGGGKIMDVDGEDGMSNSREQGASDEDETVRGRRSEDAPSSSFPIPTTS